MTQIIDLGKLRFSFRGDWDVGTEYEFNDVIKYGGNVYCYTNAAKSTAFLPTNTGYWTLMLQGIHFLGVYSSGTAYRVGDGVSYGGKVYINIADSTGVAPSNTANWSQFADGIQYEGTFSSGTNYQKNDIVTYGGVVYIAKGDTVGNDPTNGTYWAKLVDGMSAKGVYSSGTAYVPGDLTLYGSNLYIAIQNTTGNLPTNGTYWLLLITGFAYTGTWSNVTAYKVGEIVTYSGSLYRSISDNVGTAPPTNTGTWTKLVYGHKNLGAWVTTTAYLVDDVVTYGASTYVCLVAHTAGTFATDLAASKWQKLTSGIRYRGAWQATTAYLKDDVVTDTNNSYIVLADYTSGNTSAQADKTAGSLAYLAQGMTQVPVMTGQQNKYLSNDGTNATWVKPGFNNRGYYLSIR